jgi:hypothetical protein
MSGRRGRATALIPAMAALALCVMPGLAAAGQSLGTVDGITYLHEMGSATISAPFDVELPCPDGTRPTGGGFAVGLHQTDSLRGTLPADLDADGRIDGWRVIAETGQPSTAVGADAWAICRGGKLRYASKSGQLPAGSPGALKLTARCPNGFRVTGGGALAGAPPPSGDPRVAEVLYSHPIDGRDDDTKPDDGWRARLYGTEQAETKVIAICAETRQKYVQGDTSPVQADGGGSGRFVSCPATRHVLGIGGLIGGPVGEARQHSADPGDAFSLHENHDEDTVPDDNASASFVNEAGAPKTGTVYGICG